MMVVCGGGGGGNECVVGEREKTESLGQDEGEDGVRDNERMCC